MPSTASTSTPGSAFLVAIGGFAGACTRYGVDLAVALVLSDATATLGATLLVNVLGSLALGILFFGGSEGWLLDERLTLVLATGFLSSFSTYSTFVIDAVLANPPTASSYILASYVLGIGAAVIGRWGRDRFGRQSRGQSAVRGDNP